MEEYDSDPESVDVTELVDHNGLVTLFANRSRARILVALFYAEKPLTVGEIAEIAGMYQSVVYEALEPLDAFDVIEERDSDEGTRYELDDGDELVEQLRSVAELATNRYFDAT